ncbi:DNA polymerase III subunit [Robertkochia marina]|uniref:DNA polymerase III subunit n=1 Tax=Robertkochia marina TaxID=1227945 RepID=A0A4S3M537_9FLAO|nr:DNA polymerase III subunit delta' [Robertkochia marina]THD69327.1 DNA polymerase III subunit [Robertkochia marina]TRZ47412.1 DNA polymerase III subunit delta' [Robertkochia marina]
MQFEDITGQEHIINHLKQSADHGRIPHAQLFTGPEGCGLLPMAIAYARYVICGNAGANASACQLKFDNFAHPDLHFSYPVNTSDKIKKDPTSKDYAKEWTAFLKEQPYGNLFDWLLSIGIEKKQGNISVHEAKDIVKNMSLKAYEGGYKVNIIWMAENMNIPCANKLLKLIEEPPAKTVFILLAEDEEALLQTIRSRCQVIHFPPLSEAAVAAALQAKGMEQAQALKLAHRADGNLNKAFDLMEHRSEDEVFEKWFVTWVRTAFKAKGNKQVVNDLIAWSDEVGKTGRETQKKFIHYCIEVFRQALVYNYNAKELAFMEFDTGFQLEKFAPFVHGNNITDIHKELETALYQVERNVNSKVIFTDLSLSLTRLLHRKSE